MPKKPSSPGVQLADRIIAFCSRHEIPLQRIFEAAHINRSTFSRWRAGRVNPTVITQERVNLVLTHFQA